MGLEDFEIKPGDIVRLLQPFRPELCGFQEYTFGLVAGVVKDSFYVPDAKQAAEGCQPGLDGLVVYLYEPDSSMTYTDQFGVKALFSFDSDEVELYKASQTVAFEQHQ